MDALTPDDLARIEELAEKATQEPWVLSRSKNWIAAHGDDLFRVTACDADAALVIELRNLAPALVAGVRSLQARLSELETEVAARDAVIEDVRGAWTGADIDTVLEAAPASVLATRDAEKWDEGYEARALRSPWARTSPDSNPYRAGVDHE